MDFLDSPASGHNFWTTCNNNIMIEFKKHEEPILEPKQDSWWERKAVFNPGAIYDNGKFYLLYRATGEWENYISRFGLATSSDGINFERVSEEPVFQGTEEYDKGGVEDARIIKFEDKFLITYASLPKTPAERGPIKEYLKKLQKDLNAPRLHVFSHTAVLFSKDLLTFERFGRITLPDIDDRDGLIFPEKFNGRYALIHRPTEWTGEQYGTEKPGIWLSFSDDMKNWDNHKLLAKPESDWECKKIGGGPPPLRTSEGWLLIYHGVDRNHKYHAGVMLLDLENPAKILARLPYPVLSPEKNHEIHGDIPNVVFPTANIIIDNTIYVYYGAADHLCCLATVDLKKLLDELSKFKIS